MLGCGRISVVESGGGVFGSLCLFCVGWWLVCVCVWGKMFHIAIWASTHQRTGYV